MIIMSWCREKANMFSIHMNFFPANNHLNATCILVNQFMTGSTWHMPDVKGDPGSGPG